MKRAALARAAEVSRKHTYSLARDRYGDEQT